MTSRIVILISALRKFSVFSRTTLTINTYAGHFVKGLLFDDIMGYKIFTHEIHSSYAARIDNYQSYDTISKDIIQRWTYPFVLDVMFSGNSATHLEREGMYRASEIEQSRSAHIGSYIWDSVTIEDGCDIRHAIICDGVVIKSGAALEPGVVLSFKVVIGQQCIVPSYSKVSLYQQPTVEDSDKELEYVDNSSGIVDSSIICTVDTLNREMMSASQLGPGGVSHVWSICEGAREEEWRHSVAPIPADKLTEAIQSLEDDLELLNLYGNALSVSRELKSGRNGTDSEDDDVEDSRDDSIYYEREALEIPHATAGELRKSAASIIDAWNKLLKFYSKEIDPQIEVIMKFEEMCLESVKEFSPHFSQILHLLYDKDILEEDAILRQCRNINYGNLDSFLCNECGYSKYGRFELNFMAKPSFTLDSMENDEDMERGGASSSFDELPCTKKLSMVQVATSRFVISRSPNNCYGRATTFVTRCLEILQVLSKHLNLKKQLVTVASYLSCLRIIFIKAQKRLVYKLELYFVFSPKAMTRCLKRLKVQGGDLGDKEMSICFSNMALGGSAVLVGFLKFLKTISISLNLSMALLQATLALGESAAKYFELLFKMVASEDARPFLIVADV
ncbi:hypothetical protein OIU76_014802 [Salix suchowensis]|nr:hypothetical protein OIU76_014802 [Salix suchowensis]